MRRNYDKEAKVELLRRLGGRCICCGEMDISFLQIDHKHGHGSVHRRLIKPGDSRSAARVSSRMLLGDLKKRGFPKILDLGNGVYDELQVLCANCNYAKSHMGYCPHNPEDTLEDKHWVEESPGFWRSEQMELFLDLSKW